MAVDVTDTQRREVAEKLRAEAESWRCYREDDSAFCMSDSEFTEAVLEDFGIDDMDMPAYEVLNQMADIVDRPTCHVVEHKTHCGSYGCEEAGELWTLSCGDECVNDSDFPPSYCPECGAMVLDEEETDGQ